MKGNKRYNLLAEWVNNPSGSFNACSFEDYTATPEKKRKQRGKSFEVQASIFENVGIG